MPYLVKQVSGELLTFIEGKTSIVNDIKADIGLEDFAEVNDFTAFTQNFSNVTETSTIAAQTQYGLKNKTQFIEILISYPL